MAEQITQIIKAITSGDEELAEEAVREIPSLSLLLYDELIQSLVKIVEAEDIDHRWWALRAIALIPDSRVDPRISLQVVDILLGAVTDENPELRQCAALGLKLHPAAKAIPPLVNALEDSDNLVATLAADSLITIGEPSVVPLLDVMENGSQSARREAVRALVKIGDKRAIPVLFKALDDDSALVAHWAEQGLDDMGLGTVLFKPD